MKIIILEGIATSGKTTIKNLLAKGFQDKGVSCEFVDEDKTLMPILENTDKDVAIQFLLQILEKLSNESKKNAVFIFDRFYFTHIFRTGSNLKDFHEIEAFLARNQTILVVLTINDQQISERIFKAIQHRDSEWEKYVRAKGNDQKIVEYYIKQQAFILNLAEETTLPVLIDDTSDMDFERISKDILSNFYLKLDES